MLTTFYSSRHLSNWLLAMLLLLSGMVRAQAPRPRNVMLDYNDDLPAHLLISAQPALEFKLIIRNGWGGPSDSISGPVVVRYRLNRGPVLGTTTVAGLPLTGATFVQFTLPALPLGTNQVVAWVQLPARYHDLNPANDTVRATIRIVDAAHTEPRLTLVEEFTASTCPPCAPLAAAVRQWETQLPQRNSAVVVALPQDFPAPGCYYNTPNITAYSQYAVASLPTLRVNGRYQSQSLTSTDLHLPDELARPAVVHLDASYYRNPATGQFTVWTSATALADFTNIDASNDPFYRPSTRLWAAWVEPQVPAVNATNGQTVLYHTCHYLNKVPVKTDTLGVPGTRTVLPALTYTPVAADHVVNPDSLGIVVWLQRTAHGSWDPVLQAVRARRLTAPLATSPATPTAFRLRLSPNPATASTTVYFALPHAQQVTLSLTDALGRNVGIRPTFGLAAGPQALLLDLRGLAPGLYLVRLTGGIVGTTTQRVLVE